MAARLWTHGWDFYAPYTDLVFHLYDPPISKPKYWDVDWSAAAAALFVTRLRRPHRFAVKLQSEKRLRFLLGLPVKGSFDRTELDVYGLGQVRTLQEYLQHSRVAAAAASVVL